MLLIHSLTEVSLSPTVKRWEATAYIHSMCRQISECKNDVREFFRTAKETIAGGHYHNTIDAYTKNAVLICGDYGME